MTERNPRRRSDKVRRKLNQESRSAVRQAVRRAVEPPVVQPRGKKGFKQIPKAYDSDDASAVKRRFRPGWRLLSLALVGLLSYVLLTAWRSPEYQISSIQISGLQRLTEDEVLAYVDVIGESVFMIQPEEIKDVITAKFPELRDIQVTVSLPAKITVSVIERQPMFIWKTDETIVWIDTEGYLIPARGTASDMLTILADSLPIYQLDEDLQDDGAVKIIQDKSINKPGISDMAFFGQTKHIDSSLLVGVLQLNAWMPDELFLLYQKQRGLGWEDSRGWDVFVGRKLESINDKMVMYETIVRELEDQGINPSMVSVEFLHAPYYRLD